MRALVVQHVDVEGPYEVGRALTAAGIDLDVRLVPGDALPADLDGVDALVVMGGPQSAYADDGFPTRRAELALLGEALRRGIPTLAVCLGAQLLAEAAGGRAVPGHGDEIGWGDVHTSGAPDRLFDGLPPVFTPLHWHGDTVELPDDAVLLASSAAYPNQAFRAGPAAWGIQFHVEVDAAAVAAFVDRFAGDPAIATDADHHLARLAPVRRALLERFAAQVTDPVRRTRAFFGPRAAGWDDRFPDDDDAYRAAAAALAPSGIVLDVGCGTGRALPHLGAGAIGVDVTPEMLDVARGRGRPLVHADGARLPFADGSVDAVFAAGFVTHLADPGAGLAELARITRPGGRLAIFHPIGRAALAARHGRLPGPDDLLDPANLPAALAAAGWQVLDVDDGDDRYLALAVAGT